MLHISIYDKYYSLFILLTVQLLPYKTQFSSIGVLSTHSIYEVSKGEQKLDMRHVSLSL